MVITQGEEAAEMLRVATTSTAVNDRIYDYEIKNGAVLIRKADKQCLYIKRKRKHVVALDGTVEEFKALYQLTGNAEIKDMIECVEEII